jgi:hypothetical protein
LGIKKLCSILLAICLIVSSFSTAFAIGDVTPPATSEKSKQPVERKVHPGSKMAKILEAKNMAKNLGKGAQPDVYGPEEEVRVIVELSASPVAQRLSQRGKLFRQASETTIEQMQTEIKSQQDKVLKNVKDAKISFKQRGSYTNIVNGFSGTVKFKDIERLKRQSDVKGVYIANKYYPSRATSVVDMGAAALHAGNPSLQGEGMIIAIVDSGIDYRHEEFGGDGTEVAVGTDDLTDTDLTDNVEKGYTLKVIGGYNWADRNNDVIDRNDLNGNHGTHVAGIAAGAGNSSDATVGKGVAPQALLLAEKVFSNDPDVGWAYSDDIIAGVDHAVASGADVINMSLGSSFGYVDVNDPEMQAVQRAVDAGIIVAVAASNDGMISFPDEPTWKDYATVGSPAVWPGAFTVAAAGKTMGGSYEIADYSSWGPTPDLGFKPNITAPGTNIKSPVDYPNYASYPGTSMATPHIAGAAALVKQALESKGWSTSVDVIEAALANTSLVLNSVDASPYLPIAQGSGMVQVDRAVNTPVVVYTSGGETGAAAGEVGRSFTLSLVAKNLSNASVTYNTGSTDVYTEDVDSETGWVNVTAVSGASVTFNTSEVTIPANGEATFSATVTLPDTLAQGRFISGWVKLSHSSNPELILPYSGFFGDWNAVPMFNGHFSEQENSLNALVQTALYYEDTEFVPGMDHDQANFSHDAVAFSPNGDGLGDGIYPYFSQLRNAQIMEVQVLDSQRNVLRTLDRAEKSGKSLEAWGHSWDGEVVNQANGQSEVVPEGQYYIAIKAISALGDPSVVADWQKLEFPVKVDLAEPTLELTAEQGVGNTIALTLNGSDAGGSALWGYDVYIDGEYVKTIAPETTSDVIDVTVGRVHEVTVVAYDNAYNYVEATQNVTVTTDFNYTGNTYLEVPDGNVTLNWTVSDKVSKVVVTDGNAYSLDVPRSDTGEGSWSSALTKGYYNITLTVYALDGVTVLGSQEVGIYVNAVSSVSVTPLTVGSGVYLGAQVEVAYTLETNAVSKVVIKATDYLGAVIDSVELTGGNVAGPAVIDIVSEDISYMVVEAYNDLDVLIGQKSEYVGIDDQDIELNSITEAYAEIGRDDYFKVPSEKFTLDVTVTEQVYRIDVSAAHWGSSRSVIQSVYEPGNTISVDLTTAPGFVGNGNYSVKLQGYAEDGTELDWAFEYFNVLVYNKGPLVSVTSEWPVFQRDYSTVTWSVYDGGTQPASYTYTLYGETQYPGQLTLDSIGSGTLEGDVTSDGNNFSSVVDGGKAYYYLTAYDGADGTGNVIGQMFYLIRVDNSKPEIDYDWIDSPMPGDIFDSTSVRIDDLEIEDYTKVTVRINDVATPPTDEYWSFDEYEYDLEDHYVTLTEGVQILKIEAEDEAGNISRLNRRILVDATAPVISLSGSQTVDTTDSTYTVSGTVSDALSLSKITINGNTVYYDSAMLNYAGIASSKSINYTLSLSEGTNYVVIVATDWAGHETVQTITVNKTTASSGGSGGDSDGSTGGGSIGDGGGGIVVTNPDEEDGVTEEVDGDGGTIESEDGEFSLVVGENSLTTGETTGEITIKKIANEEILPSRDAMLAGNAVSISGKNISLSQNATLTLRVDGETAVKIDTRKLGIWKLVPQSVTTASLTGKSASTSGMPTVVTTSTGEKSVWVPIGGTYDTTTGKVKVQIDELGTYAVMYSTKIFADLERHWAQDFVEVLSAKGVVNGYNDTEFKPEGDVSRAEFIKMLVKGVGLPVANVDKTKATFRDVPSSHWAHAYVEAAIRAGIVTGIDSYTFDPNGKVTREQAVTMLMRALRLAKSEPVVNGARSTFTDDTKISTYATEYVDLAVKAGFTSGYEDGSFRPKRVTTRAEATKFIYKLMDLMKRI